MDSPNISMLIGATLLATLTSCWHEHEDCPGYDIGVDEMIDSAAYTSMLQATAEYDIAWDELDADEKCVAACAFTGNHVQGYPYGIDVDACSLTLILDEGEF